VYFGDNERIATKEIGFDGLNPTLTRDSRNQTGVAMISEWGLNC
jgi:hypothetical protein